MSKILFFFVVYGMGFLTAIPIGATQVEIAKRSLNGHLFAAWMVVIGSVVSDVIYGTVALFGIAPFLKDKTVISIFWFVSAIILLILAVITLNQNSDHKIKNPDNIFLGNNKFSVVTGFSLAITNPMMIFWWLIGEKIVKDAGIVKDFTTLTKVTFLFLGGTGLGSYLTILSIVLYRAKKIFSRKDMRKLNYLLGLVLILISIYFFISSISHFPL